MTARTSDRSEAVREDVEVRDEDELSAASGDDGSDALRPDSSDRARDRDADVRHLTDARTAVEFGHELYIDTTNLVAALPARPPARSLEIGCGYGRLTPWIAARAEEHHAVDRAWQLLAVAAFEYPDVRFHCARAEALPFSDDAFDLAVTWGVLNHVPSDAVGTAAAEMRRVVAPDGVLIVSEATDGTDDPRWEYRSVDEWRELFSPRELVECVATERDDEPFRDPEREHVVMEFR